MSYVHEPHSPLSPPAYPPGLPLLLAPAYRESGLNFDAFKRITVLSLAIALCAACLLFRRDLTAGALVVFAGLTAFSPTLWDFKDNILSEFPYMLFLYGAALAAAPASVAPRLQGVIIGLLIGAAAGTRGIGLLLLPALVLSDLLAHKKLERRTWWALASCSLVVLLLTLVGSVTSNADQFAAANAVGFRRNLRLYIGELVGMLPGSNAGAIDDFLRWLLIRWGLANAPAPPLALGIGEGFALIVAGFAAIGWTSRVVRGCSFLDAYAPMHILATAAFPVVQGVRYVIPLLPLILFYAVVGFRRAERRVGRFGRVLAVVAAVACAAQYSARFAAFDYGPLREGVEEPRARAFLASVRQHTSAEGLILFGKPRALALLTGRRSAEPCRELTDADCWMRIRRLGATRIGMGPFNDEHRVKALVERSRSQLEPLYTNGRYALYRIRIQPR